MNLWTNCQMTRKDFPGPDFRHPYLRSGDSQAGLIAYVSPHDSEDGCSWGDLQTTMTLPSIKSAECLGNAQDTFQSAIWYGPGSVCMLEVVTIRPTQPRGREPSRHT